jgi:hypothetical protein
LIYLLANEAHPRVLEARREFLARIVESIDEVNAPLAAEVQSAIRRIADRDWTRKAVKEELAALNAKYSTRLESNLIGLVRDSANYGNRYQERVERYGLAYATAILASEVDWAYKSRPQAVIAYIKGRAAAAKRAFRGELTVSDRLHKMTRRELREITRRVLTAIREGQNIGAAGHELLEASKGFAVKMKIPPKTLTQFTDAVRKMETLLDVDHSAELAKLERYVKRLQAGGRVQSAYREVIQDLTKYDPTQTHVE